MYSTIINAPFPDYEVEPPGLSTQTVRLTLTIAGQAVATRVVTSSTSTYYYLFTNHLGSTVLMASQNSAKNQLEPITGSQATYYPFGDYRGLPPTQTLTDRGFTGQKSNNQPSADLGLLYYNARYYAPGLARFISADTIVPDPANPQQFNRYAYTLNNPTRFTDPSGHCIVQYSGDVQMNNPPYGTSGLCPNTATPVQEGHAAVANYHNSLGEPPNYPIYNTLANANTPCALSLNECFYYRNRQGVRFNYLKDFAQYDESNPISLTEFNQLLTGVAGELYLHDVDSPGFYGQRGSYDTPFYNGGGNSSPNPDGLWPHDQKVCIESIGCYRRSEINYFAQGMWSAAAGESLATAKAIAFVWKEWEYHEPPTEGVYFWIEYGFRYYEERANRWKRLQ